MATYTDALLVYNNGKLQKISSTDNIGVSGNVSIGGDLNVQGDIVATGSTNALISDAFFDLSSGNTNSASPRPGGLTVNVKASGSSENVTAFTAGVAMTSAPTLTMSAGSSFAAGDIIQISGASDVTNNGLFIVASAVSTTVTLYGVGGTAVPAYALFCQNQVATGTMSAVATKVDLALLAVSDGVSIKDSSGVAIAAGKIARAYYAAATVSNFNGTGVGTGFTEMGDATVSTTLQNAYEGGNTIGLSSTHGDLAVSVSSGTAAITLDANDASNFTVAANSLTLSTTTSGNVNVSAAGVLHLDGASGVELNSVGANTIQIGNDANSGAISVGTGAAARNLTLGNATGATTVTVNTGSGGLDVNALGDVTVDTSASAISIDAVGARSNFTVTNERLDLKSVGSFATGNQVLIESTNSGGTSQVVAQADSNVLMQAPTVSPYLYFLADADAGTKFVAMEADNNAAGIYIGSEPYNSFIAIGTDGSRIVDIGNTNSGTEVNLHAQAGVSVEGTLTGDTYFRPGQYATISLPTGAAGALIYDSTISQPKWHDGSAWQTFGSLSASTLQQAYEGGNTIALSAAEGDLAISVPSGSAAVTIDTTKASWFKTTGAALSLQTVTSGTLDVTSAGALDIDSVGALSLNSSGAAINIGNDAVAQGINVGTGAAARPVAIGNATSGTSAAITAHDLSLRMNATEAPGYQSIYLENQFSSGAGDIYLSVNNGSDLYMDSTGYTYFQNYVNNHFTDIDSANFTGTVNLGTGAAAKTVNLGTSNSTSTTAINAGTGGLTLDATGVVELNSSGAAIGIGNDANAYGINIGTGAAARTITIGNATGATAIDLVSGTGGVDVTGTFTGSSYLRTAQDVTSSLPSASGVKGALIYDTTLDAPVYSDGTSWLTYTSQAQTFKLNAASSSGIVKGNILYLAATSGNAGLSDNNDSATYEPVAVAKENAPGGGGLFVVQAAVGIPVMMKFKSGEAPSGTGDIGKVVYLSDTAGEATLTAPSASGSRVYRLGIVKDSTSVGGLYEVVYLPAFIADL